MEIEIEVYKGQTIKYDDEYDKFVCDISVEDKFKQAKRGSLKDLRKEIDVFYKANLDFKPFKALEADAWYNIMVKEIKSIRTDNKLIVSNGWRDSHYGAKEAAGLRQFNYDIVKESMALEKEKEAFLKEHDNRKKKLASKLLPLDLTKYNLS